MVLKPYYAEKNFPVTLQCFFNHCTNGTKPEATAATAATASNRKGRTSGTA